MNGGDAATGRVTSPMFTLDGARLTLRLGGGTDATKLRAELWVDEAQQIFSRVGLVGPHWDLPAADERF